MPKKAKPNFLTIAGFFELLSETEIEEVFGWLEQFKTTAPNWKSYSASAVTPEAAENIVFRMCVLIYRSMDHVASDERKIVIVNGRKFINEIYAKAEKAGAKIKSTNDHFRPFERSALSMG